MKSEIGKSTDFAIPSAVFQSILHFHLTLAVKISDELVLLNNPKENKVAI